MKVTSTPLPGVLILEPDVFGDARGVFFESFNQQTFAEATGLQVHFVQDNHARSTRGTLRGLHFQAPHAQGKLVRVSQGVVFDVAVDLRPASAAYGRWFGLELSEENKCQLWVPPGLAHGYLTLSDVTDFLYKATDYYAPACERYLRWNDPEIGIAWPLDGAPVLSAKDAAAPGLRELEAVISGP